MKDPFKGLASNQIDRKLAALGAAIVLMALALDPFFQQLLDFPERWTLIKQTCELPRISHYVPALPEVFVGGEQWVTQDGNLVPVAEKFFYEMGTPEIHSANGTRAEFPFSCPTNNCTWPTYETLGVCHACEDVSELLSWACLDTELDWLSSLDGSGPSGTEAEFPTGRACGWFINATSENPVLMSGYATLPDEEATQEVLLTRTLPLTTLQKLPLYGDGSINFKNYRNTMLDALIVSAANGRNSIFLNETPIALECVLTWCVKTIKSNYALGRYEENVTRTFINTTDGPYPWTSEPYEEEDLKTVTIDYLAEINLDVSEYPLDPDAAPRTTSNYGVTAATAFETNMIFDVAFPSFTTIKNTSSSNVYRYGIGTQGPGLTRYMHKNPWLAPNDIPNHMNRFAKALTDAMRAAPNHKTLEGKAYNEETYVGVRWEWITLPAGLLLFTMVFLLTTIVRSSRNRDNVGVWKTSAVATLLYGFPDDMQHKIAVNSTSGGTPRSEAKEMKVRLVPKMGWRVSESIFSSRTPNVRQQQAPPGWL